MTGHFWYSEKQRQNNVRMYEQGIGSFNHDNFCIIEGKTMIYTEMNSQEKFSSSKWDDKIYLGFGKYSHNVQRPEPRNRPKYSPLERLSVSMEYAKKMLAEQKQDDEWPDIIGD
jgi:hypothetical protein